MLLLQPTHLQSIKAHAEETYPHECCGLMLGHAHPGTTSSRPTRTVVELWSVTNAWDEAAQSTMTALAGEAIPPNANSVPPQTLTTRRRYWIDPTDMLAAQRYARIHDLSIIGIYHSHPDHPAVPSECDRACAWPEYSYIIVSVPNGNATDVFSWTLDDDHQFQPENIRVMQRYPGFLDPLLV